MKELSVGEQRYKAVMAVVSDGRTVTEGGRGWGGGRAKGPSRRARHGRGGDGAVAAGCGGRVSSGGRHHRQGPHRAGRPLEILCGGSLDASRADQQGV